MAVIKLAYVLCGAATGWSCRAAGLTNERGISSCAKRDERLNDPSPARVGTVNRIYVLGTANASCHKDHSCQECLLRLLQQSLFVGYREILDGQSLNSVAGPRLRASGSSEPVLYISPMSPARHI